MFVANDFVTLCEQGRLSVHRIYDSDGYTVEVFEPDLFYEVFVFVTRNVVADVTDSWRYDLFAPTHISAFPDKDRHAALVDAFERCIEINGVRSYDP